MLTRGLCRLCELLGWCLDPVDVLAVLELGRHPLRVGKHEVQAAAPGHTGSGGWSGNNVAVGGVGSLCQPAEADHPQGLPLDDAPAVQRKAPRKLHAADDQHDEVVVRHRGRARTARWQL